MRTIGLMGWREENLSYTGNLAPGRPGPKTTRGHNCTLSPPSLPGASPAPAGGLPGQTRRPKKRPRRPKILPRGVQEGSKRAHEHSKRPQHSPRPFQDGLRWPPDGPRRPRDAPRGLQEAPPDGSKRQISLVFQWFLNVFLVLTSSGPERPKTAQECPNIVPRQPKRPPKGP